MQNEQPQMFQDPKEFVRLLEIVSTFSTRTILEIGSLFGGTLWHWLHMYPKPEYVISIDTAVGQLDERHPKQMESWRQWHEWSKERGVGFTHFEMDSRLPQTAQAIQQGMPVIDFLFIDGAHDEASVRADWNNYSPLVRSGGVIAFHDIAYEQGSQWYGVKPLWEELRRTYPHEEIVMRPGEWGIGVVYKP